MINFLRFVLCVSFFSGVTSSVQGMVSESSADQLAETCMFCYENSEELNKRHEKNVRLAHIVILPCSGKQQNHASCQNCLIKFSNMHEKPLCPFDKSPIEKKYWNLPLTTKEKYHFHGKRFFNGLSAGLDLPEHLANSLGVISGNMTGGACLLGINCIQYLVPRLKMNLVHKQLIIDEAAYVGYLSSLGGSMAFMHCASSTIAVPTILCPILDVGGHYINKTFPATYNDLNATRRYPKSSKVSTGLGYAVGTAVSLYALKKVGDAMGKINF